MVEHQLKRLKCKVHRLVAFYDPVLDKAVQLVPIMNEITFSK